MFFSPPIVIESKVFSSLSKVTPWAKNNQAWRDGQPIGTPYVSLLEGPTFDSCGNLYCVDLPNGRIVRFAGNGTVEEIIQYDGWPNGMKHHKDGRIFIADYKHGIMALDPESHTISPILERYGTERFKAVNDLFFSSTGELYFTDQGLTGHQDPSGRLFRLRTNGILECLMDNIPSPNGLVMNLDESALYLAVTRANAVWRVPFRNDGSIAKVGTFVQLSGGAGPDGLALDIEGRLAIAHAGMGCVWLVDQYGEPIYRINTSVGKHTTNVAYGGYDRKTLYITESASASVLTANLDVPGKQMYGDPN